LTRTNWRGVVKKDLQRLGLTWEVAEVAALDRLEWRRRVVQYVHMDQGLRMLDSPTKNGPGQLQPHVQTLGRSARPGILLKYVKYNTFVSFLAVLFFSIFSTGQTAAAVHTLNGSNDMFPCKEVPFGS